MSLPEQQREVKKEGRELSRLVKRCEAGKEWVDRKRKKWRRGGGLIKRAAVGTDRTDGVKAAWEASSV